MLQGLPENGGNNRARTYDPLLVRQMLSQLSYAPIATPLHAADFIIASSFLFVNPFFEIFLVFFKKIFGAVFYGLFLLIINKIQIKIHKIVLFTHFIYVIIENEKIFVRQKDAKERGFYVIT